jgi:large subunit ribosomal protein L32e
MTEKKSDKKKLLEVRKTIKDKKPEFKQQDFHKKKRIGDHWRRPTGLQSKMRHQFKGYARRVKQGWRSPVEVRGLHQKGLEVVMIHNVKELETIKPASQGVMIAATVGNKKRLEIVNKAETLKLQVLNIKVDKFKAKVAKVAEDKKKDKEQKTEKKKKTIEDSLKKAEKKEKDKEKKDKSVETPEEIDEQKAEEKKVKDDVIIHGQN